ncbi:MAG: hypothetical protein SNJ56_03745 [Termitinemataceae bacterium]
MNYKEVVHLLVQVITSWEVLGVTVVLIVYMFLVFYVSRLYHRPRSFDLLEKKSPKQKKPAAEPEVED